VGESSTGVSHPEGQAEIGGEVLPFSKQHFSGAAAVRGRSVIDASLGFLKEVRMKARLIGLASSLVALFATAGAAWKF
jgi:hypothetical protein